MDGDVHLAAIAAGDDVAFARWLAFAEHEVRVALRSFAAVVDVEAVLQEALLRVWQAAPRVAPDGKPNALLRFAVRVARNAAISELRRHKGTTSDPSAYERAIASASREEGPDAPDPLLRDATRACVEALPAQAKRVVLARLEGAGLVPDERLAAALSMRRNTFLQNVTRAKRALYECLRGKGITLGLSVEGGAR